jgi:hypothetical protein
MIRPSLLLLVGCVLLGGCAARETVTLERGGRLVTVGSAATDASMQVLRQVRAANEEARIQILMADPSCNFREILIAGDTAGPDTILCSPDGLPFAEVKAAAIAPTIQLIDGVTAYLSAVDDVVGGTVFDSGAAVEQAFQDANAIATIATAGGKGIFNPDQVAAAGGLASILGQIADARDRTARLRIIEREHGQLPKVIDALDRDIGIWAGSSLPANHAAIDAAMDTRALQLRQALERERKLGSGLAGDAQWRAFLDSRVAIKRQQEASQALPREMGKAIGALRRAHASYARLLDPDAKLTDADRTEIREEARRQFSAVLSAVAAAFQAFL